MKVKDTYLSVVMLGDTGMHLKRGLFKGDVLGEVIVQASGNRGRDEDGDGKHEPGRSTGNYTHCFTVTELPDPEAEVVSVGKDRYGRDIYKVKDKKKSGLKCHSTWPWVKEEHIDWEQHHFELWRVREVSRRYWVGGGVTPQVAHDMIAWVRARKGRIYNWLQFITLGLFRLAHSWVCSCFLHRGWYEVTQTEPNPIILSPDGKFDALPTPNDLINGLQMIRVTYLGKLPENTSG